MKREKRQTTPLTPEIDLAGHRRWVESDGREGFRLSLRGASLVGADFSGAILRGADLSDAHLRNGLFTETDLADADLSGADFQGADLTRADLRRARLRDTIFHDATLASADLSEATNLLGGQLSGSNLAGARLPESLGDFEAMGNVTEASKTTQNLFASILLVCSYTWLTIASTTDPQLLNNAAPPASRLPILGTDIPLVRFYMVAPLLLICMYIYFHLCLQRLWEELADLPAVFPDGRPLDKKAYPWLMNVVVRAHLPRLSANRSNLSRWQARMSILLGWGLVPMTILILWSRYLRGHDSVGTTIHVLMIAASAAAGTGFLSLAATTLKGAEKRPFLWRKAWGDARARSYGAGFAALILFATLSYGAIAGVDPDASDRAVAVNGPISPFSPRRFVPPMLGYLGISTFAHLDDASMSTKPANWVSHGTTNDLDAVKGADLSKRDLRHASAYQVFLVNAYMMDVDAREADFREGDLRKSDFRRASLQGANFRGANLEAADLRYADLTQAKLTEAQLGKAKLTEANLRDAQLRDAHAAFADFSRADLRRADLSGAYLASADLSGADLREVVGLTQEQLDVAIHDAETRLPTGLRGTSKLAQQR